MVLEGDDLEIPLEILECSTVKIVILAGPFQAIKIRVLDKGPSSRRQ